MVRAAAEKRQVTFRNCSEVGSELLATAAGVGDSGACSVDPHVLEEAAASSEPTLGVSVPQEGWGQDDILGTTQTGMFIAGLSCGAGSPCRLLGPLQTAC